MGKGTERILIEGVCLIFLFILLSRLKDMALHDESNRLWELMFERYPELCCIKEHNRDIMESLILETVKGIEIRIILEPYPYDLAHFGFSCICEYRRRNETNWTYASQMRKSETPDEAVGSALANIFENIIRKNYRPKS